jgi:hypothetical protein
MFTAEEDEILLDWVERVRERGLALWSERHWQELADKVGFPDGSRAALTMVVSTS